VRNNPAVALGLTGPQLFCLGLLGALGLYYGRRRSIAQRAVSA
jgi:hypothetical protein